MVLTAEHKIQRQGWIQIQLLPPYIHLNLPVSTPAPWIFVLLEFRPITNWKIWKRTETWMDGCW